MGQGPGVGCVEEDRQGSCGERVDSMGGAEEGSNNRDVGRDVAAEEEGGREACNKGRLFQDEADAVDKGELDGGELAPVFVLDGSACGSFFEPGPDFCVRVDAGPVDGGREGSMGLSRPDEAGKDDGVGSACVLAERRRVGQRNNLGGRQRQH